MEPRISIVVPTYCESENIPRLLRELIESLGRDFEIVIVDDDSPDKTWLVAIECMVKMGVRGVVVRRLGLRGLATAVVDGMAFARGEDITVMDADLQHPPSYVGKLVKALEDSGCDIAIASRYIPGGGVVGWSVVRKVISKLATLIAKLLLPEARRISDPMSGFFAVKRELISDSRNSLKPLGYKILLEIIAKTRPKCVVEVPYVFRPRAAGKSKLGIKQIVYFVIHVLTLSGWRPFKFALVGIAGTVVNLSTLALLSLAIPALTTRLFVIGSAIAIEISTLFNFSLHERWTFRDRRSGKLISRLMRFHLSVAPAVLTQYAVANFLRYALSVEALLAQFIGIALGFLVNYVLSELKVWRGRKLNVIKVRG